jgi:hypothetical protein
MQRRVTELLVVVTVNAGICAVMLAAQTAVAQQQFRLDARPPGAQSESAANGCLDAPAVALSASAVVGGGGVCLDDGGAHVTLRVSNLSIGDVYTAWLAYYDRPAACAQQPCGLVDLTGDDPSGVLVRLGGGVAREDAELELRSALPDLRFAAGAQVTLLLLHHGPLAQADLRARSRQLLTAQTPDLGAPLAGTFADGRRAWPHAQVVLLLR